MGEITLIAILLTAFLFCMVVVTFAKILTWFLSKKKVRDE